MSEKIIYTIEKILSLKEAPPSQVLHKDLDKLFVNTDGFWDPMKAYSSSSGSSVIIDGGNTQLYDTNKKGKTGGGGLLSEGGSLKDIEIVLGPEKRQWGNGCHVSAFSPSTRGGKLTGRGGSRSQFNNNNGKGGIIRRGMIRGDWRRNGFDNEAEPEWMSAGPLTVGDTIELKGMVTEEKDVSELKPFFDTITEQGLSEDRSFLTLDKNEELLKVEEDHDNDDDDEVLLEEIFGENKKKDCPTNWEDIVCSVGNNNFNVLHGEEVERVKNNNFNLLNIIKPTASTATTTTSSSSTSSIVMEEALKKMLLKSEKIQAEKNIQPQGSGGGNMKTLEEIEAAILQEEESRRFEEEMEIRRIAEEEARLERERVLEAVVQKMEISSPERIIPLVYELRGKVNTQPMGARRDEIEAFIGILQQTQVFKRHLSQPPPPSLGSVMESLKQHSSQLHQGRFQPMSLPFKQQGNNLMPIGGGQQQQRITSSSNMSNHSHNLMMAMMMSQNNNANSSRPNNFDFMGATTSPPQQQQHAFNISSNVVHPNSRPIMRQQPIQNPTLTNNNLVIDHFNVGRPIMKAKPQPSFPQQQQPSESDHDILMRNLRQGRNNFPTQQQQQFQGGIGHNYNNNNGNMFESMMAGARRDQEQKQMLFMKQLNRPLPSSAHIVRLEELEAEQGLGPNPPSNNDFPHFRM